MSLDTLSNIKIRLGITESSDDTLIGLLQASADQVIAHFCDRDFAGGSFTEYFAGGSRFLFLRNFPIANVTTVKVDPTYGFGPETILANTAYVIHLERGIIESLNGAFLPSGRGGLVNSVLERGQTGPRTVQVTYSTPTGEVPADVKQAYARLIGTWYRQYKTEVASNFQNVSKETFGDSNVTYSQTLPTSIPGEVQQMLLPYRVPSL